MSVFAGKQSHDATFPLAYRVTVACCGRRIDGVRTAGPMTEFPYYLDSARRSITLRALQRLCRRRRWTLLAAAVSAAGFQVVVSASQPPPVAVANLKRAATSALRSAGLDGARTRRWAEGAGCRFLWKAASVEREIASITEADKTVERFKAPNCPAPDSRRRVLWAAL